MREKLFLLMVLVYSMDWDLKISYGLSLPKLHQCALLYEILV